MPLRDFLTSHPLNQFKRGRFFYAAYDGAYFALCAMVIALLWAFDIGPVFAGPAWWWGLALPVVVYALIWAHLVIHTCTHGSLPRSVNRMVGELLGLVVIVRFASWGIIHLRHHRFSDDRERDPHPNFSSFWKTAWNTVMQVERQLFAQYFEVWGDTPATRAAERRRAWVSYATNVVLVLAWAKVWGAWFTLLVFGPANLMAGLFIIHFNWSTHNGEAACSEFDFRPVNLNRGYYSVANRLFAGIYMHDNHHSRPALFNPAMLDASERT